MSDFPNPPANVQISLPGGYLSEGWHGWFRLVARLFSRGQTTVVPLAKLTGGGANGSLTFVNGILVSATAPT